MIFIIKKVIFIFVIGVLFTSCGLPDVNTIALDLNEPFITRAIPKNNSVTIEFVSQNDEPAFSGYNIYFSDDETQPRLYSVRNQQQQLPTIRANGSADIRTETFTIETGLDSVKQGVEGIHRLDEDDLANGQPLYIWVTSYQIAPTRESSIVDNFVAEATPRFQVIGETRAVGENMSIESNPIATLVFEGATLRLQNVANGTMQMRTARSLTDINTAPTSGYASDSLPAIAGRLYLIKLGTGVSDDSNYGKIFVRSVNGTTSIVVDYALQTATGILSY